jgi:serralysin
MDMGGGDNQHGAVVDLSLGKNQITDDGYGNTEAAKNIEAVGGTKFNDSLTLGNHDGGWAWGNSGDDVLVAGIAINQWFGGGDGADTFVFGSALALSLGAGRDIIDDFSQVEGDAIDLTGIPGLSFVGTSQFGDVAGEVRYEIVGDVTVVSIDLDGNGDADVELELTGMIALSGDDVLLA